MAFIKPTPSTNSSSHLKGLYVLSQVAASCLNEIGQLLPHQDVRMQIYPLSVIQSQCLTGMPNGILRSEAGAGGQELPVCRPGVRVHSVPGPQQGLDSCLAALLLQARNHIICLYM